MSAVERKILHFLEKGKHFHEKIKNDLPDKRDEVIINVIIETEPLQQFQITIWDDSSVTYELWDEDEEGLEEYGTFDDFMLSVSEVSVRRISLLKHVRSSVPKTVLTYGVDVLAEEKL